MTSESNRRYCAAQVRTYDYDRYFSAVLARRDARRGLMALYAFNIEIASVAERVSEPLIGEMRLQWWRDTIAEAGDAGTVRNHAVAEELAWAIRTFDLPLEALDRMIDARTFDLDPEPPEDFSALESYVRATGGDLAVLAGTVCGGAVHAEILSAAGRAWALTGLLRAVRFHASIGKVFIPRDILREANLTPDALVGRRDPGDISGPVARLAARAGELAEDVDACLRDLPRPVRPAVAHLPVAREYLSRLARAGHDVRAPSLEPPRLARQLRTLRAGLRGRM